ncbi:class I SAM-dependent methyltransferase [Haliangium sp.]|uniref:class I SAM-dependent methyltransferase n=1 Tax=Haliangium sp. TaxID=2663208 RepID=UPI003D11B4C8
MTSHSHDPPAIKHFPDAAKYQGEIRRLVPGYDALHAMWPALLPVALGSPAEARVLFVGAGPGDEVVALAQAQPGWVIDALEPSPSMAAAARMAVESRDLTGRVRVHEVAMAGFEPTGEYDAVVTLLVGHFVADDGARAGFVDRIARALRPGGVAVLAEIEDDGQARQLMAAAHVAWARGAGLSEDRLEDMSSRLDHGFHMLTRDRLEELLRQAGLRHVVEFFRCFGVVGRLLDKADDRR